MTAWDIARQRQIRTFGRDLLAVASLAVDRSGKMLASAANGWMTPSNEIKLYETGSWSYGGAPARS
jgi:hypothetical protein